MISKEYESLLEILGQPKVNETKETVIDDILRQKIKELLKSGKDTPIIIEELELSKSQELYKTIAALRTEIKIESESLYKTNNLDKEKGPFNTVFKI